MITLPNFDDQSFEEIMEAARNRIPVIYPQWTDRNAHDPGITILELFAWLKEMQQYHLNRIPLSAYESMLALLGSAVREARPAQTSVMLPESSLPGNLPRGQRLETSAGLIFEIGETVRVNRFRLLNVYVQDGTGCRNVLDMIREPGIYCHAFGQQPVEGKSALYIGLDRLVPEEEFSLTLQLDDCFPVARNPFREDSPMPRELVWEYAISGKAGPEFVPVEQVRDGSFAFSQSGKVTFRIAQQAIPGSPEAGLPECFWLRARLIGRGCEENPRLSGIVKDSAEAEQQRTRCETLEFTLEAITGEAVLELRTWLALNGRHIAFVRDSLGWQIHNALQTGKEDDGLEETAVLALAGLPADLALDGAPNIRILCCEEEFAAAMVLPGSDGLPCQRFTFQPGDEVLRDHLSLLVYEETDEGPKRWLEWTYTGRLSSAGPYDRCFTYDRTAGELVFGDNDRGAVPQAGENNMLVTRCVTTCGSLGNISPQKFAVPEHGMIAGKPENPFPAAGGRDAEDIRTALDRVRSSLKQVTRAVTAADYELLAAATPGLRIRGVRAIPFYDPDSRVVGDKKAPATVTVVVLPYSEIAFPAPDSHFLEAVGRYLEEYRLITTRVRVIGPAYIKISVYAEILLENNFRNDRDWEVKTAVEAYFAELRGESPAGGPEFGQTLRESLVSMKIGAVPGVSQVKKVTLGVRDSDSYRDKYGNIVIPPQGLPYLGELQIRTLV